MATKPAHKSWAGLVIQQQSMLEGSSRQESIASEKSCDTVSGSAGRLQTHERVASIDTGEDGPVMETADGMQRTQRTQRIESMQSMQTNQKTRHGVEEETRTPQRREPAQSSQGTRTTPLTPKEQICFDFTKGQCRRGSSCKFSHDVAHIIRVNSQEKGICFDFLKGTCARGVMCRFSHDLNNLKTQEQGGLGIGEENVVHGKRQAHVPICYDFVKNKCSKGDLCRYSHDYSNIMTKMSGGRRGNGSGNLSGNGSGNVTPSRGSKLHSQVIGATMHTPEGQPRMNTVQQTCVDFLRGNCPRGPFCEMAHSLPSRAQSPSGSHDQPESLESLINRLKKMQYEQAMVAENTAMLARPHQGMACNGSFPDQYSSRMHQTHQGNHVHHGRAMHQKTVATEATLATLAMQRHQLHNTFSYPPPTSMFSDGARMMSAHWSSRHAPERNGFEEGNYGQYDGHFSPDALSPMSPMSPPVTHAEKARFSARMQVLQQQGIGASHLAAFPGLNNTAECGSPMIGAGWQTPGTIGPGADQISNQSDEDFGAAEDLINMMTMRTIWADEQG